MLLEHASLSELNTLRMPATARWLARPASEGELIELLRDPQLKDIPRYVIGDGSNLLLSSDIDALVIRPAMQGVQVREEDQSSVVVEAGAGENWDVFVGACLEQGWYGLENLSLIPGTVGAAPYQNIGAYGVELADRFESLTAINLLTAERREFSVEDCCFGYRDSFFKSVEPGVWLITAVRLRLSKLADPVLGYADLSARFNELPVSKQTPQGLRELVCGLRRSKLPDPASLANAGSFFKNPVVSAAQCQSLQQRFPGIVSYTQTNGSCKLAAGWLIEHAGWKGKRLGPAGMHAAQALVMVNYGGAVFTDIQRVAETVQRDVFEKFGVQLEREPVLMP